MNLYDPPARWTPPDNEHPRVTELRRQIAKDERDWLARWVLHLDVMDVDLVAAFAHISYENARKLLALQLEVQCNCGDIKDYKCPYCRAKEEM